ncbi:MAG: cardiolipin synthase [Opitutales bacterium]
MKKTNDLLMLATNPTSDFFRELWPLFAAGTTLLITIVASVHAILTKRETSAAVGWVGIIWLVPFIGALIYLTLGVNRIRRRAKSRRSDVPHVEIPEPAPVRSLGAIAERLPPEGKHLTALAKVINKVTTQKLIPGNSLKPLVNGDEAYPEMLKAIQSARTSISLTTYIFANDPTGREFCDALARAVKRGVEVRILIDAVGLRYSFPSILRYLRGSGIRVARFMPSAVPWRMPYMNLRTHRKILTVDGKVSFTGGMNIAQGNRLLESPRHPIQDLHFRVEGPVVRELQECFVDDWAFSTREILTKDIWFPPLGEVGPVIARGITDGPDENFDRLRLSILGAIASARKSIRITTPYFLPDQSIISAINTAAMRDVAVDIILPLHNNLRFVNWASMAQVWQMLRWGARIWQSPPPFDHTKLMIVDDHWLLLGSANWDPRSLFLNFEFNVECYDHTLAHSLVNLFERKRERSHLLTLEEVRARSFPIKLRDGIARLLSPYL